MQIQRLISNRISSSSIDSTEQIEIASVSIIFSLPDKCEAVIGLNEGCFQRVLILAVNRIFL